MILNRSGISQKPLNPSALWRRLATIGGLLVVAALCASSTPAEAQRAHFRYNGGSWSHARHAGWNRYWGGPSIGFYFAPYPVYVVSGYAAPSYYSGSSFWYANPSFGLSLNLGGGGGRNYRGGGGNYSGGRSRGNVRYSGHGGGGGRSAGGGRSHGGGGRGGGGRR